MIARFRRTLPCALLVALVVGCADGSTPPQSVQLEASVAPSSAAATPTTGPTATPEVFRFPDGSTIAGVDVSGLTEPNAIRTVSLGLIKWQKPLALVSAEVPLDAPPTIRPDQAGIVADVPQLVAQGVDAARNGQPATIAWEPQLDPERLQAALQDAAASYDQTAAADIITDTESLTATYTFRQRTGVELDIDATADLLAPLLIDPTRTATDTVILRTTPPQRPSLAELERVLEEHLGYWRGVGGIYVHDLETGETIGINENTVFSGASVMKVPIMIYTYAQLGELNAKQREWMEGMILDSDNLDANALLAAAAGGQGTEIALEGVNQMSAMMRGLGLQYTYQLIPYESAEWLIQQSLFPRGGPEREGEPPYTAADRYLRTTPREMGELFTMLAQCADGKGKLLETYADTLSEELCDEMMAWLERPHDEERMVAGLPPGTQVAHKGGWIDDMQSDVGIVSSPGGRYVAAIYIWRPDGYVTDIHASPSPYLGDFSHTIYSFFNPEPLDE
jgi:beta-lactamase class A